MKKILKHGLRTEINGQIEKLICQSRLKDKPLMPLKPLGIDEQLAEHLYTLKCKDLAIAQNSEAKDKFVHCFLSAIREKSLMFSNIGITSSGMSYLLSAIGVGTSFAVLDLSCNRLEDTGAEIVAAFIKCNSYIASIDLRSNNIGQKGSRDIFKALRYNTHVVEIDFSTISGNHRNRVDQEGAEELGYTLKQNQVLQSINLSAIGLTPESCASIWNGAVSSESLTAIDLSQNRIGPKGGKALFNYEGALGNLQRINLARCCIGDAAAFLLLSKMKMDNSLESIDLSHNNLTTDFMKQLRSFTSKYTIGLTSINLSHNFIGDDSGSTIVLFLKDSPSITSLDISYNPLGDEASHTILKSIYNGCQLVTLKMNGVGAGNKAAKAAANIIVNSTVLKSLSLASNSISDEGGIPIARALITNSTLTALLLQDNEMRDTAAEAFSEALSRNETLEVCDLTNNEFEVKAYKIAQEAVALHTARLRKNSVNIIQTDLERLKQRELRLFELHDEVKAERKGIEEAIKRREALTTQLAEQEEKQKEILQNLEQEVGEMKIKHDETTKRRRRAVASLSDVKTRSDAELHEGERRLNELVAKNQLAKSRIERAEKKQLEISVAAHHVIDDLQQHLAVLVDQIETSISQAKMIQDRLKRQASNAS